MKEGFSIRFVCRLYSDMSWCAVSWCIGSIFADWNRKVIIKCWQSMGNNNGNLRFGDGFNGIASWWKMGLIHIEIIIIWNVMISIKCLMDNMLCRGMRCVQRDWNRSGLLILIWIWELRWYCYLWFSWYRFHMDRWWNIIRDCQKWSKCKVRSSGGKGIIIKLQRTMYFGFNIQSSHVVSCCGAPALMYDLIKFTKFVSRVMCLLGLFKRHIFSFFPICFIVFPSSSRKVLETSSTVSQWLDHYVLKMSPLFFRS